MGQAIPRQHPAVVLRSHYNALRALLALVLIVAAGLTATVVILATDDDDSVTASAGPVESINYGGFSPLTGRPNTAPLPQQDTVVLPQRKLDGATDVPRRYDGGPEEGSSAAAIAEPSGPELRRTAPEAQPFGGQRP